LAHTSWLSLTPIQEIAIAGILMQLKSI